MALSVNNDYRVIENIYGDKEKINFLITIYPNKDTKNYFVNQKSYSFTPSFNDNSPNLIKQGYEYLKTLDEFKNSIDC